MNWQCFSNVFRKHVYFKILILIFICKAMCVGIIIQNITSNLWMHHRSLIQSRQSWGLRRSRIHQSAFALPSKRTLSDGILGCLSGCIEPPFTATKKPSPGRTNTDNNAGISWISSKKRKKTVLPVLRKKCRLELFSLNIDELSAPFGAVGEYTLTCR